MLDLEQEPLKACYEVVLSERHKPGVDVTMDFVIGADGRVSSATLTRDSRLSSASVRV